MWLLLPLAAHAASPVYSTMIGATASASSVTTSSWTPSAGAAYVIKAGSVSSATNTFTLTLSNGDLYLPLNVGANGPGVNCNRTGGAGENCTWLVCNSSGSAGTIQVSSSGSPTDMTVGAWAYTGNASLCLEAYSPAVSSFNVTSLATNSVKTLTSNTTLIAIGFSEHGVATFAASGYTARTTVANSNVTLGVLDIAEASGGTYSTTINSSGVNMDDALLIALRSVLPAHDIVQSQFCNATTGVTSLTCPMFASVPGDTLLAFRWARSDTDITNSCIPTFADSAGDTGVRVSPLEFHSVDIPGGLGQFYIPNASSSTSVTLNTPSCSQLMDMIAVEIHGVAPTEPMAAATIGFPATGTQASIDVNTPLTLGAGTYVLVSALGNTAGGTPANTYTPTSSWSGYSWPNGSPTYLRGFWSQPTSGGSTYSNALAVGGAQQIANNSLEWILAFQATDFANSRVVQMSDGGNGGTSSTTSKTFTLPTVSGHNLFAYCGWAATGTPTISSSPSLSWGTPLFVGTNGAAWRVTNVAAATYNVTCTTTGATTTPALVIGEDVSGNGIDVNTLTGSTGTSFSPSGTSTKSNELILDGIFGGDSSVSATHILSTWNQGQYVLHASGSHLANIAILSQWGAPPATYNSSWTVGASQTANYGVLGFIGSIPPLQVQAVNLKAVNVQ